jgi:hypothetical protein
LIILLSSLVYFVINEMEVSYLIWYQLQSQPQ